MKVGQPETVTYPIAPETVTVLGERWKAGALWDSLLFRHPGCRVRTQSTAFVALLGRWEAPDDLHLDVPFWHPGHTIPPPAEVAVSYRVRPRARAGGQWNKRRVTDVAIEPDPDMDPPWRIVVTFERRVAPRDRGRTRA